MKTMSKTSKAFSAESNIDRIERVLERRRSNAAGTHQNKGLRRQRTRNAIRLNLRKEAMA